MSVATSPRELAAREHDGFHVRLLWEPETNQVFIQVDDRRLGVRFEAPVAPERANHAFVHPFTYAVA